MTDSEEISEEKIGNSFQRLVDDFPKIGSKIKTGEFIHITRELINLIEKFGKVFSPVIYDMKNNIKVLNAEYYYETSDYIEDLIRNEKNDHHYCCIRALTELKRELQFLTLFIKLIIEDTGNPKVSNDLSKFLKKAYADTLEIYHGWLGTQLYNVLSRFLPTRFQLFRLMGAEKNDKFGLGVVRDMQAYTEKMDALDEKLSQFIIDNDLESAE